MIKELSSIKQYFKLDNTDLSILFDTSEQLITKLLKGKRPTPEEGTKIYIIFEIVNTFKIAGIKDGSQLSKLKNKKGKPIFDLVKLGENKESYIFNLIQEYYKFVDCYEIIEFSEYDYISPNKNSIFVGEYNNLIN